MTVLVTVTPETVAHLAASFAYLLEKGVVNLSISPLLSSPGWDGIDPFPEFERRFDAIAKTSIRHHRETGEIPFVPFRSDRVPPLLPWERSAMCGVLHGRSPAVDVDGTVYGCAMLIGRGAADARDWLEEELSRLTIGHVGDRSLAQAFEGFALRGASSPMLTNKQEKQSGFARCGECLAIAECDLCPVSIGMMRDNEDRHRVPDFACAFQKARFRAKKRFRSSLLAPRSTG